MQTIGERLEDARKRKGVSIREAAEATKIRGDYLQKFESNQFDFELADIYKRGFLRNYALYLKLPAERIVDDFESLGRQDTRPRQPSREIYGRMDVSISTADERPENGGAASVPASGGAEASPRSGPQLRAHSSLPKTPPIDPALAFKAGIAVVVVVVLLLIVWLAKSIVGGSAAAPPARPPVATAPVAEPSVTLIALDTVHATVTLQADGRVLADTTLTRGQRLVVPRPGTVIIEADVGANLQFEVNGRLLQMPAGANRVKLESSRG